MHHMLYNLVLDITQYQMKKLMGHCSVMSIVIPGTAVIELCVVIVGCGGHQQWWCLSWWQIYGVSDGVDSLPW